MKKITFPIKEGAQGSEISNLQDALFLLLENNAFLRDDAVAKQRMSAALRHEYVKEVFGVGTLALVGAFQKERGLKESGSVDEPTADAINTLLRKFEFLDEEDAGWAKIISLLWNAIWRGKWYRQNKRAEIVRILNVQRRTLNAINLDTEQLKRLNEKIGAPLGKSMFSFDTRRDFLSGKRDDFIKELHAQLKSLGFAIPSSETIDGIFGVGTHDALLEFQTKKKLPLTGELDDATREALDAAADEIKNPKRVEGRIFLDSGLPAAKVKLRMIDKGFGEGAEKLLGEIETDEHGFYDVSNIKIGVNLEVRAVNNGKEIPLSNPKVIAEQNTVMHLVAPSEVKPQASEFKLLSDNLAEILKVSSANLKEKLSTAQENEDRQDLTLLHQSTGWDARLIATAATAAKVSGGSRIDPGALYGAFRAGLPTDAEALAHVSADAFAAALTRAKDAGVISLDDAQTKAAQEEFKTFAIDKRSKIIAPGTVSSMDDMIKSAVIDPAHKKTFRDLVLTHDGDDSTLWTKAKDEGIPTQQINSLQLQGKLAYLTLNNAQLTQKLQTEIASQDNLPQLVEKDLYQRDEWKKRLNALAGDDPATRDANLAKLIPPAYTQENVAARLDAYAGDLAQKVRQSFPTQTVKRMIEKDELKLGVQHAEMKAPVQAFLEKAVDKGFQLGRTPVEQFLKRQGETAFEGINTEKERALATEGVKTLARVYQMTPNDESMTTLLELGFTSARQVAAIPKDEFLIRYEGKFGSRQVTEMVWDKSTQITSVTFNIYTLVKKIDSTPPISAIAGSPERLENAKENLKSLLKEYPTMESLFGSLDFCECEHCRSVLSPAAYLVDLLRFIDPSEEAWKLTLDNWKEKHNNKKYDGSEYNYLKPYDALTKRRPDLPYLPLTCENTNTAMPYIDIVNEILEYFVANENKLDEKAVRDTGEATSGELMAEPQNIVTEAYTELKNARYPLTLPFDLWLETVRRFCEYFETPLWQFLEIFRPSDELFAPAVNPADYYRAQIFSEYLGLSPAEYALYTNPNMANWFELYGFNNEGSAFNELKMARTLSRRLNLSYKELVELVKTAYVNPNLDALVFLRKLDLEANEVFRFKEFAGYPPFTPDEKLEFGNRLTQLDEKFKPDFSAEQKLNELWAQHKFEKILVLHDANAGGSFDETTVRFADGTKADALSFLKLNLFTRLWKRLGWTIEEIDLALKTFLPAGAEVSPGDGLKTALIYMAHLKELNGLLKVGRNSRVKLLTLWSDLPTKGKNSLYAQTFLTRNILKDDAVFDHPLGLFLADQNVLLGKHLLALQSALNLTAGEIAQILRDGNTGDERDIDKAKLTLSNVSMLYRYGLLAKTLKLPVDELIALKTLSGLDPFHKLNPGELKNISDDHPFMHTIEFVRRVKQIKAGELDVKDLDYLFRHRFDPIGEYRKNSEGNLPWLKTLATTLRTIASDYAVPAEAEGISDDALRQKMSAVFAPDVVEMFMGFWLNQNVYSSVTDQLVAPNQRLDPIRYNLNDLSVSYDETRQRQQVSHIGVLTGLAKDILLNQIPLPVPSTPDDAAARTNFENLLADIVLNSSTQFEEFFVRHFDGMLKFENFFGAGVLPNQDEKRLSLLKKILPFLEKKLARQTILQAITAQTGGDAALIETLLTSKEFLSLPAASDKSLLELFEDLGHRGFTAVLTPSPSPLIPSPPSIEKTLEEIKVNPADKYDHGQWQSYIEVPSGGAYRFYAKLGKKDATVNLRFGSASEPVLNGTASKDDDEISGFTELKAGVLYEFTLEAGKLQEGEFELLVKGETTSKDNFSKLFVMPRKQVDMASRAYVMLDKSLQLAQGLGLSERDVRHILANPQDFGGVDWRRFPTTAEDADAANAVAQFKGFVRLADYAALKRDMAGGSDDLIAVFEAARMSTPETVAEICKRIEILTRRQPGFVNAAAAELQMTVAGHFAEETRIERLWQALQILEKLGIQVASSKKWLKPQPDATVAIDVRNTIKSRYEPETWQRIAKEIFDPLRQRQRDALVAFIMANRADLDSVEKLFEYFLIDPGSEPVLQTSRLRLAISSLQTFIQRCFLNLEKQVHPSILNAQHWSWMKRYRVWEANRKIFLFPENWLEPEWRDDKTHLYQELEGSLLQGDVTNQLAEDALYVYLKKLDQLARLEIVTMYAEEKPPGPPVIHVIGRTYTVPHQYFYRRYAHRMWTPWEPVSAEIESDHIVAVVWRERLHLFWLTFLEKVEEAPGGPRSSEEGKGHLANMPLNTLVKNAAESAKSAINRKLDIQLNWSEYFQGEWTVPESSGFGNSIDLDDPFDPGKVFVTVSKEASPETGSDGAVFINLNGLTFWRPFEARMVSARRTGTFGGDSLGIISPATPYFRVISKNSRPQRLETTMSELTSAYSNSSKRYNTFEGYGSLSVTFQKEIVTTDGVRKVVTPVPQTILSNIGSHTLLPTSNRMTMPNAEFAPLISPVFYADEMYTFLVEPSLTETTVDKWESYTIPIYVPDPVINIIEKPPLISPVIPPRFGPFPGPAEIFKPEIDERAIFQIKPSVDTITQTGVAVQYGNVIVGGTGIVQEGDIVRNVITDVGGGFNLKDIKEVQFDG